MTPGHVSTLNVTGSRFHVKFWPRVMIQRWILTPVSWFHVHLWPQIKLWPGIGITIQCGILTRGYNSTWNFDLGSQFNVEFWPVYISSSGGIATLEGVKIQQRDQNSTTNEGHNSTKNPLNIDPESVFNWGGVKILSYTGRGFESRCRRLFSCWIFRSLPVPNRSADSIQIKSSMTLHLYLWLF